MGAVGFGLICLTLIVAFSQKSSEGVSWNEVALAGLLIATLGVALGSALATRRLSGPSFTAPLLVFIMAWLPFNVVWALANGVDLGWAARRAAPLAASGIIALSVVQLTRTFRQIVLIYQLVAWGSALVVASTFPVLSIADVLHLQEFRQASEEMGGYYSVLAATLLMPIALTTTNKHVQVMSSLGTIIAIVGIVLGLTRTYWFVTVVSFLCIIVFVGTRWHTVRRVSGLCVFVVLVVTMIGFMGETRVISFVFDRFDDVLSAGQDPSVLNRWQEAQGAFMALTETPFAVVLGRGIGRDFIFYSINPFYPKGVGYVSTDYSHNFYLYLWLQLGFPGLVLFLWPYLVTCAWGIRWVRSYPTYMLWPVTGGVTSVLGLLLASVVAPPLLFTGTAIHIGAVAGASYAALRFATTLGSAAGQTRQPVSSLSNPNLQQGRVVTRG